jgi:hypothetical protein
MVLPPGLQVASRGLRDQWSVAEFQHRRQLDQLRLVLVGVMLAEQEFRAGGQLGTNPCGSTAPITPISPG